MESMVCASFLITAAASLALPQRFSASDFLPDGGKQAACFESHPAV
jgi:hypothetical protein